jgi:hypothetical protein
MNEAGKGDKQRPTDHQSFSKNFEAIFGKKPTEEQESNATDAMKRQLSDAISLSSDPSGFKSRALRLKSDGND